MNYTKFDISRFKLLESLEIGEDSFRSIELFLINDLPELRSLKIGLNSFSKLKNKVSRYESKSFHILNCKSLESIEIGANSFSDFGGEFELSNLKSLKSIKIGSIDNISCNYLYSSFTIRGMFYHSIYK